MTVTSTGEGRAGRPDGPGEALPESTGKPPPGGTTGPATCDTPSGGHHGLGLPTSTGLAPRPLLAAQPRTECWEACHADTLITME